MFTSKVHYIILSAYNSVWTPLPAHSKCFPHNKTQTNSPSHCSYLALCPVTTLIGSPPERFWRSSFQWWWFSLRFPRYRCGVRSALQSYRPGSFVAGVRPDCQASGSLGPMMVCPHWREQGLRNCIHSLRASLYWKKFKPGINHGLVLSQVFVWDEIFVLSDYNAALSTVSDYWWKSCLPRKQFQRLLTTFVNHARQKLGAFISLKVKVLQT